MLAAEHWDAKNPSELSGDLQNGYDPAMLPHSGLWPRRLHGGPPCEPGSWNLPLRDCLGPVHADEVISRSS